MRALQYIRGKLANHATENFPKAFKNAGIAAPARPHLEDGLFYGYELENSDMQRGANLDDESETLRKKANIVKQARKNAEELRRFSHVPLAGSQSNHLFHLPTHPKRVSSVPPESPERLTLELSPDEKAALREPGFVGVVKAVNSDTRKALDTVSVEEKEFYVNLYKQYLVHRLEQFRIKSHELHTKSPQRGTKSGKRSYDDTVEKEIARLNAEMQKIIDTQRVIEEEKKAKNPDVTAALKKFSEQRTLGARRSFSTSSTTQNMLHSIIMGSKEFAVRFGSPIGLPTRKTSVKSIAG